MTGPTSSAVWQEFVIKDFFIFLLHYYKSVWKFGLFVADCYCVGRLLLQKLLMSLQSKNKERDVLK